MSENQSVILLMVINNNIFFSNKAPKTRLNSQSVSYPSSYLVRAVDSSCGTQSSSFHQPIILKIRTRGLAGWASPSK